ncbi:MAG TPA: amylo-alpha-1,6-glucosidase [bacterium]|nr:amylo-alpha-1,6-glucosidase [bacterium]
MTPPARPLISFGREICGDLAAALRREWLVTNGLGGYASGTVAGLNTRRYHGLLVAALAPPLGRTMLVAGLSEWAILDGRRYPLSTHEFADGTVDPDGYRHVQAFALDGMLPVWTYAFADTLIERRVWMAHGGNSAYVGYRLVRGRGPVTLRATPLVTCRGFHVLRSGAGWRPETDADAAGVTIRADGAAPYRLVAPGGRFFADGMWWWNFLYREETSRGYDDREDLYAPGEFVFSLSHGEPVALIATAEDDPDLDAARALAEARLRQDTLVRRAGAEDADAVVRQLTLAADQFIVRRNGGDRGGDGRADGPRAGTTVIAGYHWFGDWGRDAMIALPGLTLATGRRDDGAEILRTFAGFVRDGLVPNHFPDHAGAEPAYHTADASLWFVLAAAAYGEAAGVTGAGDELRIVVRDILDRHIAGTRFGIGMDPRDGLLRAGEPGVQLTWMDAMVGETVVTPRIGKPVEINALWYNALRTAAELLAGRDDEAMSRYETLAGRVRTAFRTRFARPGQETLADVVDGPDGDDLTVRPNQIFAVSLPFPLLDGDAAAGVVRAVGRALLTTHGLRSLASDAPGYQGTYEGDLRRRDHAYHEGTVWAWLMGPYAEAYYRVTGDAAGALDLLRPFEHHLLDAGLGTLSEIFDGDPPHRPRGCIAQAWSVAEVLRVWRALAGNDPPRRAR